MTLFMSASVHSVETLNIFQYCYFNALKRNFWYVFLNMALDCFSFWTEEMFLRPELQCLLSDATVSSPTVFRVAFVC